ncbi:putative Bis(5'-nucleosyl)-tetraphosphatase [Teladorsagia circumcincta]|uniref:Bis(5'-nucleosyl)-tetraphosphatase [asymmetrical] n=1 Tax=Teladorsagia circumcincta TaxID=45464 RepID=A0A2G9UNP2_TELCI|nr:putative Bis(5'-nucleosyl)-tetraphosphatase [Teladorsagia circumcincta]
MSTVVRAAGLVVFRRISDRVEFLLLQASYSPYHWTPPKGHVDPGEDEWVAALRETKEEAGILQEQLKIYEDCHETLRYEVKGKPKTVKYWLALLKNPDDVKLSHEHQMWKWAELDEAIKIAEYAEMGALLRKFKAYVDNLKS